MSLEEYTSKDINELLQLIENNAFNTVDLDDINVLSLLHDCLIESNNLSNILNSVFNGVKDISIELKDINSLTSHVATFKNDLQDILEYQNNFFNEINKIFFNN